MKIMRSLLCGCAGLLPWVLVPAAPGQFTFTTNNDAITLTGYAGPGGAVNIPGAINGWPVTGIGDYAFYNEASLTSVSIGPTVTNIGEEAFADCTQLTAITVAAGNPAYASVAGVLFNHTLSELVQYPAGRPGGNYGIPKGVARIGDEAFQDCASLTNVTLPDGVTSLGAGAFENCLGLTRLTLPSSLTNLGDFAFEECRGLTNLTLGDNVASIGINACYGCVKLGGVLIPASVTNIGFGAFSHCSSLGAITVASNNPVYRSTDGVLFDANQTLLLQYPGGKAGDYTIPANIVVVEADAFMGSPGLTGITIPASVTNLDQLPTGRIILSRLYAPFTGCGSLAAITVASGNPCYSSLEGVLFNENQTWLLEYPAGRAGISYLAPDTVTNVGDAAFAFCDSLAGVFFQGNAPGAGGSVFIGDRNMIVYYPPEASGWNSSFGGVPAAPANPAAGLLQVTILPDSALFAGAQWRVDNGPWQSSLTVATNLAFGEHTVDFSSVSGWTAPASQTVLVSSNEIAGVTGTYTIIPFDYSINNGSVTIFGYRGPGGAVTIPDTINGLPVTGIAGLAFGPRIPPRFGGTPVTNGPVTSVAIPASVTNIQPGAFQNCPGLAAVTVSTLNSNYSSAGGVLFNQKQTTLIAYPEGKAGNSYTIPNGVTNLAVDAFWGCTQLTSVTLGGRVTSLGYGAFTGCSSLTAILVPGDNPAFASVAGVLYNKTQTTLVEYPVGNPGAAYAIPSRVTDIGNFAFESCLKLRSVTFPDSATSIGIGAFESCSNLASVTLGRRVRRIGFMAFESTKLARIAIPKSVLLIEAGAFGNCAHLEAINVEALNPAYASEAGVCFDRKRTTLLQYPPAKAGTAYAIPGQVLRIGDQAFQACGNLRSVTMPNSVTNIGLAAFENCTNLAGVTFGNRVLNIGDLAFANTRLTRLTLPNSVTSIGNAAFEDCAELTDITIPRSVTSLGASAFLGCTSLVHVIFEGNAPSLDVIGYGGEAFGNDTNATAYYHLGTRGWGTNFGGIPTAVWNPRLHSLAGTGGWPNQLVFQLAGAGNQVVVVEACTDLSQPVWVPLQTNTLSGDTLEFRDPQWGQYPSRFYRVRGLPAP